MKVYLLITFILCLISIIIIMYKAINSYTYYLVSYKFQRLGLESHGNHVLATKEGMFSYHDFKKKVEEEEGAEEVLITSIYKFRNKKEYERYIESGGDPRGFR